MVRCNQETQLAQARALYVQYPGECNYFNKRQVQLYRRHVRIEY